MSRSRSVLSAFAIAAVACIVGSCGGGGPVTSPLRSHAVVPYAAAPSATPSETAPPPSAFLANTWNGIFAFQKFDNFNNKYIISPAQAANDGPLYVAIWGSNSGQMVQAWQNNNPAIATSFYLPTGFDSDPFQFGNLGHRLAWWQANHPDWILYECDRTTVAFANGLPEVPLDISNPQVVNYLLQLAGTFSEQNGYSAVGLDFAEVRNPTGLRSGTTRGCGIWGKNPAGQLVWAQKFSGATNDPAWAAAALNFFSIARQYLHGLPRPLALWGNHVPGLNKPGSAQESQLLSYFDVINDESGYAQYGRFASDGYFTHAVYWATYLQALGKGYMPTALWPVSALTNSQIDYSIATYLMSKEQASALTAVPYGFYGIEYYYPAYKSQIGEPCAEMYGGPAYLGLGRLVYFRQFTRAIAIVSTSASATYSVTLPQKSSYVDAVTGATVSNPLPVGPFAGYMLLTSNGCAGSAQ